MPTDVSYQLLGPSSGETAENLFEDCSNKQEALQRMQALLSEWLRMENLVVLTGSGCSIDCGGKTMSNLEKSVLKSVKKITKLSEEGLKLIEERLNENTAKVACTKTGFEQWLSYLVNSIYLDQEPASPVDSLKWKGADFKADDISMLVKYISKAIYAECALTWGCPR